MRIERYPYRARVWWGEAVVAQSDACWCLEREGQPSLLYFPRPAIDLSLFQLVGPASLPEGGEAEVWNAESAEGDPVLSIVTAASPELAPLQGHGRFDTDPRTSRYSTATRRTTTTTRPSASPRGGRDAPRRPARRAPRRRARFRRRRPYRRPPAGRGGEPNARPSDRRRRTPRARAPGGIRHHVVPACRRCRSAAALRAVRAECGAILHRTCRRGPSRGSSVCGRDDAPRCHGTEIVRHAVAPPDVPGPAECVPLDMGVTGRDIRVLDGAYTNDPDAPVGPPTIDCWVRFHRLPDDRALTRRPAGAVHRPHADRHCTPPP